jgi:hypothetical protein
MTAALGSHRIRVVATHINARFAANCACRAMRAFDRRHTGTGTRPARRVECRLHAEQLKTISL